MQDYSIAKSTRRCAIGGHNLEPNESYFSVLIPQGDDVARIDIAARNWQGPAEGAIGWWQNKMPSAGTKKLRPAPNGVLLDTLSELLERSGKEELAYLLALLLVRRRVLHEEQSLSVNTDHDTTWKLTCPVDGREWLVPAVAPAAENMQALQTELQTLLFTD